MDLLNRVLMLVVHRDDECLSSGGTLLRCKELYLHYYNDHHPNVEDILYDVEAELVRKALDCSVSYSAYKKVNDLRSFNSNCLITELEDVINFFQPKTVIVPAPSYNQDHRVVFDIALTALRVHDKNWYVRNVLLAEQPETSTPAYKVFYPHLYIPINIDRKLALFNLYRSQQRSHRSPEHVRAIAQVRGMQCGQEAAEAFQVIRMTEDV